MGSNARFSRCVDRSLGETYGDAETGPGARRVTRTGAEPLPELDRRAVALGDALHDGQSEATAGRGRTRGAIEAIEHARTLIERDARAVVAHRQRHGIAHNRDGDVDTPAARRVAHRVVD